MYRLEPTEHIAKIMQTYEGNFKHREVIQCEIGSKLFLFLMGKWLANEEFDIDVNGVRAMKVACVGIIKHPNLFHRSVSFIVVSNKQRRKLGKRK